MKRFLILAAILLLLAGCSKGKTTSQQNETPSVPEAAAAQDAVQRDASPAAGTPAQENAASPDGPTAQTSTAPAREADEPSTQKNAASPDGSNAQTSAAPAPDAPAQKADELPAQDADAANTSKPFVPQGVIVPDAPADEGEREPTGLYHFPALQKTENMDNALLYRACESMVQYAQFQGATVNDFEIEDAGKSADGWAQFRVTLHTDRGDYSVVQTENGRIVSDSIQ